MTVFVSLLQSQRVFFIAVPIAVCTHSVFIDVFLSQYYWHCLLVMYLHHCVFITVFIALHVYRSFDRHMYFHQCICMYLYYCNVITVFLSLFQTGAGARGGVRKGVRRGGDGD